MKHLSHARSLAFNALAQGKQTFRMSDVELLAFGFTQAEIDAGEHFLPVSGAVSNSSQLITDMASAITNAPWSTTAQAAASAAAGPITDLQGVLTTVKLNFQEAAEKLAYVLQGTMIQSGSPLTAPTGGLITSAADSATYNLLVGIYQILK